MLLATEPSLTLRLLFELGYAQQIKGPSILDFDPRLGVDVDSRRKVGRNVRSSVRRIFVAGSSGSGKVSR
jgi:hypothetical protein